MGGNVKRVFVAAMLLGALPIAAAQGPVEQACIRIEKIRLEGMTREFAWLQPLVSPLQGQCLSEEGVTQVLRSTTNELAAAGYVTSRFYVPEQDAGTGTLTLQFVPGRVGDIRISGAKLNVSNVLTLKRGDLLTTRAIDQATDHLRRLTSLDAKILIEPAEEPGVSNLNVVLTPISPAVHGSVSIGDEDIARERTQVGDLPPGLQQVAELPIQTTLTFDNVTGHADVLSVDGTVSPGLLLEQGGLASASARYSIPKGRALFGAGASYTNNHTLQPGYESTLDYNGQSANFYADVSTVLGRTAQTQVVATQRLGVALSRSAINDVEIQVQRKNTYRVTTELSYSDNTPEVQSTFGLAHVLAFNDFLNAPETSGWSSRLEPSLGQTRRFQLADKNFVYQGTLKGQVSLVGEQYQPFSLDRNVVRGLPATAAASGPHALVSQNKVTYLAGEQFMPYATLDAGRLFGGDSDQINSAISTTLGANGQLGRTRYDVNVGLPLQSPGNGERGVTFGAQLSWNF